MGAGKATEIRLHVNRPQGFLAFNVGIKIHAPVVQDCVDPHDVTQCAKVAALTHFDHPARELLVFDYHYYFGWLLWITAGVTIWTGVDYVVKYFYMIRSVLK